MILLCHTERNTMIPLPHNRNSVTLLSYMKRNTMVILHHTERNTMVVLHHKEYHGSPPSQGIPWYSSITQKGIPWYSSITQKGIPWYSSITQKGFTMVLLHHTERNTMVLLHHTERNTMVLLHHTERNTMVLCCCWCNATQHLSHNTNSATLFFHTEEGTSHTPPSLCVCVCVRMSVCMCAHECVCVRCVVRPTYRTSHVCQSILGALFASGQGADRKGASDVGAELHWDAHRLQHSQTPLHTVLCLPTPLHTAVCPLPYTQLFVSLPTPLHTALCLPTPLHTVLCLPATQTHSTQLLLDQSLRFQRLQNIKIPWHVTPCCNQVSLPGICPPPSAQSAFLIHSSCWWKQAVLGRRCFNCPSCFFSGESGWGGGWRGVSTLQFLSLLNH